MQLSDFSIHARSRVLRNVQIYCFVMLETEDFIGVVTLLLSTLTLVLVGLLWLRNMRKQRETDKGYGAQETGLARLEELLREQERVFRREMADDQKAMEQRLGDIQKQLAEDAGKLRTDMVERFESLRKTISEGLADGRLAQQRSLNELNESLQKVLHEGITGVGKDVNAVLVRNTEELGKRVERLTESTDKRLQEISSQVDKRLSKGFEKTTETFALVLTHLNRIDEAQKKITELSSNVVSLQEVLADKRSRGAFGEVQLNALVRNLMPEESFALQYQLKNDKRVDCMLFLPEPTGNIAVDAKFPLESFRRMTDLQLADSDRDKASSQFRQDIRKHIGDIADKYIIPGETSDGAVMFIPAEAVFAEIHAHYPDLVEEAYRRRVWLVSPTTMMAILTTARAVLKDAATREQVHIIQQHLGALSKDFGRFQERMDRLSQHIRQAHDDVDQVNTSARKITSRFEKIEKVELDEGLEPTAIPEVKAKV
ncbi:DNA recombination protein RmuC [hydrothermal vent metagenome]|uniref:DNA recombination protein RmuC n=1 Tax=hydrothermal vent metagenome TaxID=652676 RepID=A0A3B1AP59_9ZZZZ